jgi:integrase
LQKKRTEALDLINKLDEKKTLDGYSAQQLKEMLDRKTHNDSFFKFAEEQVEEMNEANRIGNGRSFKSAIAALRNFTNGKDVSFTQLNYTFLTKFETAHFSKGNSQNGLGAYMRAIRAIYNKAIKLGLVERDLYPFANYSIKTAKTRKRAISIESIKKIRDLALEPSDPLYHSSNYFLLSFFMRGMPFADLAQLRLSNIKDGRIFYQRQKTDKPYNIKLTAEIQELLAQYLEGKKKEDRIFPIINREGIEGAYKDVEWARRRYNKKLKLIAEKCGIEENLTSYVSRHSFATRAKNLGVPIATISDMLGHENVKTTEVYLDTLPSDILDDFHEQIIK